MGRQRIALLAFLILIDAAPALAQPGKAGQGTAIYYPDGSWQEKRPADVGLNSRSLKEAIDFAIASEPRTRAISSSTIIRPSAASRLARQSARSRTAAILPA